MAETNLTTGKVRSNIHDMHLPPSQNDGNGYFTDVAAAHGVADSREGHGAVFLDHDFDGDLGTLPLSFPRLDEFIPGYVKFTH